MEGLATSSDALNVSYTLQDEVAMLKRRNDELAANIRTLQHFLAEARLVGVEQRRRADALDAELARIVSESADDRASSGVRVRAHQRSLDERCLVLARWPSLANNDAFTGGEFKTWRALLEWVGACALKVALPHSCPAYVLPCVNVCACSSPARSVSIPRPTGNDLDLPQSPLGSSINCVRPAHSRRSRLTASSGAKTHRSSLCLLWSDCSWRLLPRA